MKRLTLEAFKIKNANKKAQQATDKLLGQILGDCHDEPLDISPSAPKKRNKTNGQ